MGEGGTSDDSRVEIPKEEVVPLVVTRKACRKGDSEVKWCFLLDMLRSRGYQSSPISRAGKCSGKYDRKNNSVASF